MHGWSACLNRETTWPEMIMIKAIMTMITMMIIVLIGIIISRETTLPVIGSPMLANTEVPCHKYNSLTKQAFVSIQFNFIQFASI